MTAKATMMALLVGGVFVAASHQGTDHCTPVEVDRCYDRYSEPLWNPEYFSNSEDISKEDAFKDVCSVLKAKDRCHLELANCPDDVKSSFKHQERGYEAVRDIVCEGTPLKDFKVAYFCTKPQ